MVEDEKDQQPKLKSVHRDQVVRQFEGLTQRCRYYQNQEGLMEYLGILYPRVG